jgi:hypothetical protein
MGKKERKKEKESNLWFWEMQEREGEKGKYR